MTVESEENGIPILPTADIVHIKPVELDKDVQPCNLNSHKHHRESYQILSQQPELDHLLLLQFILQLRLG